LGGGVVGGTDATGEGGGSCADGDVVPPLGSEAVDCVDEDSVTADVGCADPDVEQALRHNSSRTATTTRVAMCRVRPAPRGFVSMSRSR
jgi:hypothetical protein